jgi:hypothetical protein
VHVFLQLFLNYILNTDIHQKSVMPLKVNEDAKVKKKACNTDTEEEITGFYSVPYRAAFPTRVHNFMAAVLTRLQNIPARLLRT